MRLTTNQAHWGRPITGQVVLTAGDEYVRVDHIRARLIERLEDLDCGDDAIPRRLGAVHAQVDWANNVWLEPRQQREWPFELRAPWDRDFDHLWDVQGTVRMVDGRRASILTGLEMGPPPVFESIAAAATNVTGLAVERWTFQAPWACAELPANADWQPFVERLIIRLQRDRSTLVGEVQVVLPERRGGRRLRSAALLAARPAGFHAPKHALPTAVRALEQALEALVLEHFRALYGTDDLPLPASAALDVEQLPGPSQADPRSDSQER